MSLNEEVPRRRTFSSTWLKANSGKARKERDEISDRDGLSLRITPKGRIIFQIRYRYGGKPARLDIGSYPLMSLKDARSENLRLKAELEQGHDPKIIRKIEKQDIMDAASFESMFRQWYEIYCKNKKNHNEVLRSFEIHVFPKLGKLPADKITLHS